MVDPRDQRNITHSFNDIIIISLSAMLSGAEDYKSFEAFGIAKEGFLRQFLNLKNGIPSHDTFRNVFMLLDPQKFGAWFRLWVVECYEVLLNKHICIDGKWLNGTDQKGKPQSAIKMVNAWATELGVSFGQLEVAEGSNEITTLPKLLRMLFLKGCIVTMDAAHCQAENTKIIIAQGGDYIVPVKKNQKDLYQKVELIFDTQGTTTFTETIDSRSSTQTDEHGRHETRKCEVIRDPGILNWLNPKNRWCEISSIVRITRTRSNKATPEKVSTKVIYYISSLKVNSVTFNQCVREHWKIESGLHWVLDVAFHEDACHVYDRNAAANMAILRQIAVNLIKKDKNRKNSIKTSRLEAGWNNDYLFNLIEPLLFGAT